MSSTKKAAEIKEIKDLCATIIMSVSGEVVMNQDGTWTGFTETNYIDGALSVAHAPWILDKEIKINSDNIGAVVAAVKINSDSIDAVDAKVKINSDSIDAVDAKVKINSDSIDAVDARVSDRIDAVDAKVSDTIMSVSGEVVMNQDGTWKGFTGTNYIDEALSVAHAPWLLDRKIKEIKDMLQVLIDKTADL